MARAFLNGVNVHYYMRPGVPVLVMVHGLATSLAFWYLRVLPGLRRDLGVLLFDLRGHGQSDMPPSGYTTEDMARDLHTLFRHLSIEQAHVVGHSYGGAVALHHAVLYPESVLSLTLADARIRSLQPSQRITDWPLAEQWQKKMRELDVTGMDDPEMGYRFLEALAESKRRSPADDGRLGAAFSPFGLSRGRNQTAERWLRLLHTTSARSDFTRVAGLTLERIREVHHPTLAIFGEYSHCLPSCRGLQKILPNCRVVIVPRAGHFHPVVRPSFFTREVQGFVRALHRTGGGRGRGGPRRAGSRGRNPRLWA